MKRVLAAFARNTVFANIILVLIFLAGGMAITSMTKETFPEFSMDMITITVPYPGADPEEIEEGISRKIEEAIDGIEGIRLYTTRSSEGAGTTMIEVREDYEVGDVLDNIRTRVGAISTFPATAEKPVIEEITLKDMVMLLGLSGDMSERRIKEWSERIREEIRQLPEVSSAEVFTRNYEIGIEVSEERLREYNLTLDQVTEAVRRSSINLAGGTIRSRGEDIRIRTMGRKYTGEELSSIVVFARPEGEIITLDRLATINDGFEEDPVKATINGEPSVLLTVYKTGEEDSLAISEAVRAFVTEREQRLPESLNFSILFDGTDMLKARINLLVKNGIIGLGIVFLLLWLFLNARLSFWTGMGIPIALSGAMALLWSLGGTINMISLFSLIMVLGIVVDDAIVVGEAIYVQRESGKSPLRAAVDGVSEVGMPVAVAVTTSIVAFVPLMYIGGIMGKFISILPVVVISCLVVSLVECMVILPAHLSHLPDPASEGNKKGITRGLQRVNRLSSRGLEWAISRIYLPFLRGVLSWRYLTLAVAVGILILTLGLARSGILKFEVFPEVDGFLMTATVEYPNGTPSEVTGKAIDDIDAALLRLAESTDTLSGEPLIKDRLSLVGQTLSDMPLTGPNVGSVQALLLPSERRGIHTKELMSSWEEEIGTIPGVQSLTFAGLSTGPPGAPIEVWIQGREMDDILAASESLMERLSRYEGVYQIRSDFAQGKSEIRLELKPEARTLGLTVDDLARQVHAGYYGSEAVRIQRGQDSVRVKVRYTAGERKRISDLEKIRILTRQGSRIPLRSVANISFAPGYSTITRTNGLRRVVVSAGVNTSKANANELIGELSSGFFPELAKEHPDLTIAVQGEQKKMRESFGSLAIGYPLALIGMFIIIASLFRSYAQPFVILMVVPFGIIGAVLGHLLLGFDLSIMSVFGIVALTGVVVNDAVVLIERINENIASGMSMLDSIVQGGARRFRAIFLTTISTVGGLAPIILEKDLQARILIPTALSIAAGVLFATLLTLVLIPSLLLIVNDLRLAAHRLRYGYWPEREAVEPARERHADPLAEKPALENCPAVG